MEPHLQTLAAELGSESDITAAVTLRRDWTLEHLVPGLTPSRRSRSSVDVVTSSG